VMSLSFLLLVSNGVFRNALTQLPEHLVRYGIMRLPFEDFIEGVSLNFCFLRDTFRFIFGRDFPFEKPEILVEKITNTRCELDHGNTRQSFWRHGEWVVIDMCVISACFLHGVNNTRRSDSGWRGKNFELQVRELIDVSCLAPTEEIQLKVPVGKPLKSSTGDVITDVDAIAQLTEKKLLLIQCKSHVLGDKYGHGDFNTIRAVRSQTTIEYKNFLKKTHEISTMVSGRNFDVSGLDLIPIIVTSGLEHSDDPEHLDWLPIGLRRVSSFLEFKRWLTRIQNENSLVKAGNLAVSPK
jgi:hypothetical protein